MFHVDERQLAGIALKGVIRCKNPRTSSRTITIEGLKNDCEQKTGRWGLDFLSSDLEEPFRFFRSLIVIVLGNCRGEHLAGHKFQVSAYGVETPGGVVQPFRGKLL